MTYRNVILVIKSLLQSPIRKMIHKPLTDEALEASFKGPIAIPSLSQPTTATPVHDHGQCLPLNSLFPTSLHLCSQCSSALRHSSSCKSL